MKVLLIILIALALGAALLTYHLHQRSGPGTARERSQFQFEVHAPYAQVFPLFGAEKERVWAGKDWDPTFLYPKPARDVEGAVFTIKHGHATDVPWVNTAFDLQSGHVQYVYVVPEIMTTLIDIHVTGEGMETTKVDVVYERTALTSRGDERVRRAAASDRAAGPDWASHIDGYFRSLNNR